MTETVSIIIGTYGDKDNWYPLGRKAEASAYNQTVPAKEVLWFHAPTLQQARNEGVNNATGDWLVHLDADDTLDPHYVEGILNGTGDLRQPKTLGVHPDGHTDAEAVFIEPKFWLLEGNWLIIGTGVRRELVQRVGGWGDEPFYEDWDLWLRCWKAGATIGTAPEAIYCVGVNTVGRNSPDVEAQKFWFAKIARRYR